MKKFVVILLLIVGTLALVLAVIGGGNGSQEDSYLTPATNLRDAHGMAVDVAEPNKLWIASHTGLHLLKDDKNLYHVGNARDDYMGFSTHPTDPNIFFTSGHPARGGNVGFQKSTDAGRTWQKISDGLNGPVDFHSMAVDRSNPDIVYGMYRGRMQKSIDGGSSWSYVDGVPRGVIQLTAGVTEGTLYAATQNGLHISKDQGASWTASPSLNGTVLSIAVHPTDSGELLVYSQQQGMIKSNDGGKRWKKLDTTFNEPSYYIAYAKTKPAVIYALTESLSIYKSTDSGTTWNKIR